MTPPPPQPAPDVAPSGRAREVLFGLAILGFVIAGLSHVARGLIADPADASSPARHAAFVGINALAVGGLLWRPRWIVLPFALLAVQQLHTHGGRAWAALQAGATPRLDDVLVALGMPLLVALLAHHALRGEPAPR